MSKQTEKGVRYGLAEFLSTLSVRGASFFVLEADYVTNGCKERKEKKENRGGNTNDKIDGKKRLRRRGRGRRKRRRRENACQDCIWK